MLRDLYKDEKAEDEIFVKEVNVLDIVNTSYMDGKLRLTRYKLVFMPYERQKTQKKSKSDPSRSIIEDKFVPMKLSKHKELYYNIPVHMLLSVKEYSDKKFPECCFIDISTKDFRGLRIKVVPYRDGAEIIEHLYRQAFPGFCMDSMFVRKYSYQPQNYLLPDEEETKDDATVYDCIKLTKSQKLELYFGTRELPINGWEFYSYKREMRRCGIKEDNSDFRMISCWSGNASSDYVL